MDKFTTYSDVKEFLEQWFKCNATSDEECCGDCKNCPYDWNDKLYCDALRICYNLLGEQHDQRIRKQEAKPPYHIHNVPFAWFCSNCNEQCGWIEIDYTDKPNYCRHCGIELDWGDGDD